MLLKKELSLKKKSLLLHLQTQPRKHTSLNQVE